MEIPTENKAWTYSKHGQPADVLSMSDLPIPSLSPSQVLVEIKAAGFNPVSYKAMKTFPSFMVKKPCVPENDLSGVVVASASTEFAKGDEVLGIIPAELQFKTGFGTLGKYAIVEHAHLVKKPSCSAANIELVRSLGAHDALDYKESDLSTQLATKYPVAEGKGFDIFFDTVGVQQLFDKCASYLNQNGTFVSISGDLGTAGEIAKTGKDLFMNKFLPTVLGGVPRKFSFILMKTSKDKLLKLATLCDEGKLRPVVDSTHDFNNVLEAYSVMMSGRAKGKVIVKGPSSDFYPSSSSPSSSSSSESSSSSGARIIH
eukprot:TRINITY_DN2298_c0_g1_i1.p1 TRINITY_DN2298_c0_g1~~TRINITY_DN2298_c0_g1_i1.p1  ORF type:complete len:315 (+),score=120.19 TRINITY_DN2298_c0_g1_i1:61-1005(+)